MIFAIVICYSLRVTVNVLISCSFCRFMFAVLFLLLCVILIFNYSELYYFRRFRAVFIRYVIICPLLYHIA